MKAEASRDEKGQAAAVRRAKLRTRVLLGVLAVMLVALAAFDVAAVTALRGYLVGQADVQLQHVLSLYRVASRAGAPSTPGGPGRPRASQRCLPAETKVPYWQRSERQEGDQPGPGPSCPGRSGSSMSCPCPAASVMSIRGGPA